MNAIRHIFQWRLRYEEAKAFFLFSFSWLLSHFCRKEKDLWLFAERGTDARDNGYWMFCYVMEQHPEVNAKYIISKNSEDRKRLAKWGDRLIAYGTFRHYLMIWQAKYVISTHLGGYLPSYYLREVTRFRDYFHLWAKHIKIIWLQHGVIKDDLRQCHADRVYLDMFVCGAKPEFDYVSDVYGFPPEVIQYTGLARYDGLHDVKVNEKQILLMPTWRVWLSKKADFLSSDFFQTYSALLHNERLHRLLREKEITLIFYPHYEMQSYISEFQKEVLPDCVLIADKRNYDVQQLLKESALLITDYSSVFFDFAYMRKPIIYFQFDELEYRNRHYSEGYYDYHHGLGDWCGEVDDLLELLNQQINTGFHMKEEKKRMSDDFFILHDENNCERIYKAIKRL